MRRANSGGDREPIPSRPNLTPLSNTRGKGQDLPKIEFTTHLRLHLGVKNRSVERQTVREALEAAFSDQPKLRGYVLNDQGALRKHMVIFVDGVQISDRTTLSDPVDAEGTIHVLQALSGG